MNKEQYITIYDKKPDEITLADEDIKEWIDTIVDALNTARTNNYDLFWGKLGDGGYENKIEPCDTDDYKKLQIFRGIEHIARAVGEEIKTEYIPQTQVWEHNFIYKGVEVFELSDTGDYKEK